MNDTNARLFIYGYVKQAQTHFRFLQEPLYQPDPLLQRLSHSWLLDEPIHAPLKN